MVLSKLFCFTSSKNFVRGPLCVSENSQQRKSSWIRGGRGEGGVSRFTVENFLSYSAEKVRKSVGEPFCAMFQKISGSQKFMDKRGEDKGLPSKIFCLTVPKFS